MNAAGKAMQKWYARAVIKFTKPRDQDRLLTEIVERVTLEQTVEPAHRKVCIEPWRSYQPRPQRGRIAVYI